MLDSSEIGTRSKIFFQNDTYARKDQQKMANIKLYSDWMKMTTDYAKKDPDFEYYYFDQDGKELSPLKRTGNLMSYIIGR